MGRGQLTRIKESLRALLQIRLAKERRREEIEAQKKAITDFSKRGPRSLRPKQRGKKGCKEHASVDEISELWGEGEFGRRERPT